MNKVFTADHVVLLPAFEPGVDITISAHGALEIGMNTPEGRVLVRIGLHPKLAFALRDFLLDHLRGEPDE